MASMFHLGAGNFGLPMRIGFNQFQLMSKDGMWPAPTMHSEIVHKTAQHSLEWMAAVRFVTVHSGGGFSGFICIKMAR